MVDDDDDCSGIIVMERHGSALICSFPSLMRPLASWGPHLPPGWGWAWERREGRNEAFSGG